MLKIRLVKTVYCRQGNAKRVIAVLTKSILILIVQIVRNPFGKIVLL